MSHGLRYIQAVKAGTLQVRYLAERSGHPAGALDGWRVPEMAPASGDSFKTVEVKKV